MSAPDGLLIVDKPAGWTSHDVVGRCRRLCQTRRVGHAGTLDPMATGVLVLGVNRATRLLTFLVGCDKAYTATIRLGQATITDDAEGEVTASYAVTHLTRAAVADAVAGLTGDILQVPSAVSAIKVNGRRSYARVRAGEDVALPARPVTISRFDILYQRLVDPTRALLHVSTSAAENSKDSAVCDVDVIVEVSSGTYVRALARDLGAALGVGGHLTALRRTSVGRFGLERAHPLEELAAAGEGTRVPVVPMADAARASFASHELTEAEARALGYGQRIASEQPLRTDPVAAFAPQGHLVAMLDESGALAKARVVFAPLGS